MNSNTRSGDTRAYYNHNTRSFLRPWRGSAATGAIHRPLWAPGVRTRAEAMHHIHHLIASAFVVHGIAREAAGAPPTEAARRPFIADLGCGVGAGLAYIDQNLEADLAGVTLSEVQAEMGTERLPPGIRVIQGDFMNPETLDTLCRHKGQTRSLDGAWMIEAFVHAPAAKKLLMNIAGHMRRGGVLAICDDLLSGAYQDDALSRRSLRLIEEFRRGWHIHSFHSADEIAQIAQAAGFRMIERHDLSRSVRNTMLKGFPVHLAALIARLIGTSSPAWSNLRGGSALQRLSKAGIVQYQLLLFRRN